MMKRIIEEEMETRCKKVSTALDRFFKKNPTLNYWRETFEYMAENNLDFFSDNTMADGTKNNDWCYALHLDINENDFYICVIERAEA